MLVSIVTATFNSAKTVKDTLDSVQSQSYPQIEHIIVDGISSDETINIVKKSGHKGSIHIGADKGIYDAMNKGIKLANGEIIGILNSDDFYANNSVIQKVVTLFEDLNVDTVYGDLKYVDIENTKIVKRTWIAGSYKPNSFKKGWMPPHPTFFVRKGVYEKYGLFNLSLKSAADYELLLRFLHKNRVSTAYLSETLVHMRVGGQSNSSLKNRLKANAEDRKAWKINNLRPHWYTLYLKPLRKVNQFFNNKN